MLKVSQYVPQDLRKVPIALYHYVEIGTPTKMLDFWLAEQLQHACIHKYLHTYIHTYYTHTDIATTRLTPPRGQVSEEEKRIIMYVCM